MPLSVSMSWKNGNSVSDSNSFSLFGNESKFAVCPKRNVVPKLICSLVDLCQYAGWCAVAVYLRLPHLMISFIFNTYSRLNVSMIFEGAATGGFPLPTSMLLIMRRLNPV